MDLLILTIALQQGLFSIGWWLAGWVLSLSRRAARHWGAATMGAGIGLVMLLQRGRWPDVLTIVAANLVVIASFVAVRRGVQVFLRLRPTDRESACVVLAAALALGLSITDPRYATLPVYTASSLISWTLLRCAWEARAAMRAQGEIAGARVVAAPLALLGGLQLARFIGAVLRPDLAARPLVQDNSFNSGVGVTFMVVGIVLNMVLGYLVVNRLVRRLHHRSVRDPLTGLYNRRGLAPQLEREELRLRRAQQSYALLAVDVDHFKKVNDSFGHAAGDAVLVQLARLLEEEAREVDTVARLGGEEFCLLLPHADAAGAQLAAERLCRRVRDTAWPVVGTLTISVGVAAATASDLGHEHTLTRADDALMRAKTAGRDRVVVA